MLSLGRSFQPNKPLIAHEFEGPDYLLCNGPDTGCSVVQVRPGEPPAWGCPGEQRISPASDRSVVVPYRHYPTPTEGPRPALANGRSISPRTEMGAQAIRNVAHTRSLREVPLR